MTIFFSLLVVSIVKKKDIAAEFTYGTSMSMQNKLTDQWWELCETSNRIGKDNITNVVKHMNGYDHVKLLYALNAWNAAAPQLIDPTRTNTSVDWSQERIKSQNDIVQVQVVEQQNKVIAADV